MALQKKCTHVSADWLHMSSGRPARQPDSQTTRQSTDQTETGRQTDRPNKQTKHTKSLHPILCLLLPPLVSPHKPPVRRSTPVGVAPAVRPDAPVHRPAQQHGGGRLRLISGCSCRQQRAPGLPGSLHAAGNHHRTGARAGAHIPGGGCVDAARRAPRTHDRRLRAAAAYAGADAVNRHCAVAAVRPRHACRRRRHALAGVCARAAAGVPDQSSQAATEKASARGRHVCAHPTAVGLARTGVDGGARIDLCCSNRTYDACLRAHGSAEAGSLNGGQEDSRLSKQICV